MNTASHLASHAGYAGSASRLPAFEPSVLRSNRLFQLQDIDEARDRISRVMQPHQVRALGGAVSAAGSHMDFIRTGGMGLGTIDFGTGVALDVDAIDDYYLVMFCLRGHARARVGGQYHHASQHEGIVCSPGRDFSADLSADCEQFILRLDRSMIESHAGAPVRFREHFDLREPRLQAWLEQVRGLVTSPHLMAAAQRNPLIGTELERLLVLLLVEAQGERETARAPDRGIASACVRRAENFIESHLEDALRLGDIAHAAGVPARTLLDAFSRFRDYSPMQYLKEQRLELARQRLQSSPADGRVSDVALACGFAHLGRFSQAYSQRFGESPSATLQLRRAA